MPDSQSCAYLDADARHAHGVYDDASRALAKGGLGYAFVPTLEGQYIIKNLAIVAVAISIVARIHHPEDVHDLAVNPCTNDPIIGRKRMSQSARTEA